MLRQCNPEVVRKLERLIRRLEDAKDEYETSRLPTIKVEADLRQSRQIINSIENDLRFAA